MSPALRRGDAEGAHREADEVRAIAKHHGSALLGAECAAVSALALKRLGRVSEAEQRRDEAIREFQALEAIKWIERFEEEWSDQPL
ncbi:MAG: hypothetical protein M3Q75_01830 [Gemmatimonadota bacterium]|nr:hypothetical protein [Gemmatimonadota bacterium]